jgi:hypothetical protein
VSTPETIGEIPHQEFFALKAAVRELQDRQAIVDCINRYARGVDRHDVDIILSVYHPDAEDQRGDAAYGMPKFTDWVNGLHEADYRTHSHNITTHNCKIDGDAANTESYVLFGLERLGSQQVLLGSGRYIDRLERREEVWRIASRKVAVDWMLKADGSEFHETWLRLRGYPQSVWDRTDVSYSGL